MTHKEREGTFEIELNAVSKAFVDASGRSLRNAEGKATAPALASVSLAVPKGELLVIVGPSGCGKSTTLRIVAGLEEADSGEVWIAGRAMKHVPPQDRDVAMVFQGYALYPQMTVRENLEFPLKMQKVETKARRKRADEAASMLRLGPLMARLPSELSGGERQRVAMGRAIVRTPRVFLFDEPLSSLDSALRQELRLEIGALVRELGVTSIYVTHDQVEAMTLADRICVMQKGSVLQVASPREMYESPATPFVATFLGTPRMNLLAGVADGSGGLVAGPFRLESPPFARASGKLIVGVRPDDVHLSNAGEAGFERAARFVVAASEPLGAETHLVLRTGGVEEVEMRVRVSGFYTRPLGSVVFVTLDAARVHLFGADASGARLP